MEQTSETFEVVVTHVASLPLVEEEKDKTEEMVVVVSPIPRS